MLSTGLKSGEGNVMFRIIMLVLAMVLASSPVHAEGPMVSVELNKLEANGSSCRAYLMMQNDAGLDFEWYSGASRWRLRHCGPAGPA